jgi:hypothetical protein
MMGTVIIVLVLWVAWFLVARFVTSTVWKDIVHLSKMDDELFYDEFRGFMRAWLVANILFSFGAGFILAFA